MSKLRVISGSARGRKLKMLPKKITRPITDRVKEALFNIIQNDMPGSAFLDLFAGTGSVGIESLSRGAKYAKFVDIHPQAIEAIQYNLEKTNFVDQADVIQYDALNFLDKEPDKSFDYIFVAPPQYKEIWEITVNKIDMNVEWLVSDGWVIVQIDPKEYKKLSTNNLSLIDQRTYGNTQLLFYERLDLSA